MESEGFDRRSLSLPGRQDELVERVLAVAPDAVIVINAGSPVLLPWLAQAKTVLWAWFPGQEAGHALGDVLAGRTEPSGRLPWTLPASEADVPVPHALPDADMRVIYTDGVHVGYRGWERSGAVPAAPFGHGLGWTTWSYDAAKPLDSPDGVVEFAVDCHQYRGTRGRRGGAGIRHLNSRFARMALTGPCAGSRASLASPPRPARPSPQPFDCRPPHSRGVARRRMAAARRRLPRSSLVDRFATPRLTVTHEFSPVAGEENGSAGEVSHP